MGMSMIRTVVCVCVCGSAVMCPAVWALLLGMAALVCGRSARGDADIERLLHGVMEQLGIARPREEFTAHQAANVAGPLSIQGKHHKHTQY